MRAYVLCVLKLRLFAILPALFTKRDERDMNLHDPMEMESEKKLNRKHSRMM
jgi:hypothetical protein